MGEGGGRALLRPGGEKGGPGKAPQKRRPLGWALRGERWVYYLPHPVQSQTFVQEEREHEIVIISSIYGGLASAPSLVLST